MKLNTHDRTPRPKNNKFIKGMFIFLTVLYYGMFGLVAFACIFYADRIAGGISIFLIPVIMTAIIMVIIKDMERAYVEINGDKIHTVDYYLGMKKEKVFSFSDITSAEICLGKSLKVKGYRESVSGIRYIVFRNGEKYLFKIIYLPETAEIFKQYINTAE